MWLQGKWHILTKPLKNTNFSNQIPYRLLWLLRKFYIFIKWAISRDSLLPFGVITWNIVKLLILLENINFSSQMLYRSMSNEQISRDFLLDTNQISKELYRSVHLYEILPKWTDFSEITDSKEIKEITDFKQFSKDSLLPFSASLWKNEQNEHISVKLQISVIPMEFQKRAFYRLVYLHEILSIFIKSPDFNEIKQITDFQ